MTEETDVAVVGAGGGGAVLALALAKQGIRTVVLDQATGPPKGLRGEILQPNGQRVLDRLGVLQSLPADATRSVRLFHFCRAGGTRLCSIDYGDLPAPYNRAIVTLPNVVHHAIVAAVQQQGIPELQQIWSQIAPQFSRLFRCLNDWGQTAYMPTGRIRTPTWVADGAVLIGDAAHAMNSHASQGRMQAMVDAMALADLLPSCLNDRNYSAEGWKEFERARRPQVTMLQQLADQQVFYWNTKNPVVAFLRDRVFQTLDRNARLRYQVLSTTAWLRTMPPCNLIDRVIAAGLLPDIRAHERSPHPMSL